MSQSASAVSRALHIVDDRLQDLERQVEGQRVPAAGVVEFPALRAGRRLVGRATLPPRWPRRPGASSTPPAVTAGWCGAWWRPAATPTASIPAPASSTRRSSATLDLRGEPVGRAPARRGRGRPGCRGAERHGRRDGRRASAASCWRPSGAGWRPGGTLVVHSVTRQAWEAADAPPEADLAAGRPLRPETWCSLLEQSGYEAVAQAGPGGDDFLVIAVRAAITSPYAPAER